MQHVPSCEMQRDHRRAAGQRAERVHARDPRPGDVHRVRRRRARCEPARRWPRSAGPTSRRAPAPGSQASAGASSPTASAAASARASSTNSPHRPDPRGRVGLGQRAGEPRAGEPVAALRVVLGAQADRDADRQRRDAGGAQRLVVAAEPAEHRGEEPVVDRAARRLRAGLQRVERHLEHLEVPVRRCARRAAATRRAGGSDAPGAPHGRPSTARDAACRGLRQRAEHPGAAPQRVAGAARTALDLLGQQPRRRTACSPAGGAGGSGRSGSCSAVRLCSRPISCTAPMPSVTLWWVVDHVAGPPVRAAPRPAAPATAAGRGRAGPRRTRPPTSSSCAHRAGRGQPDPAQVLVEVERRRRSPSSAPRARARARPPAGASAAPSATPTRARRPAGPSPARGRAAPAAVTLARSRGSPASARHIAVSSAFISGGRAPVQRGGHRARSGRR